MDTASAPALADIPKDLVHRRQWIRYRLRLNQLSLTAIARQAGVARQTLTDAISLPQSPRLCEMVANAIDVSPEVLFPELWQADGRLRRDITKDATRPVRSRRVETTGRD